MPKALDIVVGKEQRVSLEEIRRKQTDPRNERALAVLMAGDGISRNDIAKTLRRNLKTIYTWLSQWNNYGLEGLSLGVPSGRPSLRNEKFAPRLEAWLKHGPAHYGYGQEMWTIQLLQAQFKKETGIVLSESSVSRALKEAGFSYKRPRKSLPVNAPSKEEKKAEVLKIIEEISERAKSGKAKVILIDESHFTNEPYVIRGWYRKGKPFFPQHSRKEGTGDDLWRIRFGKREILLQYLEES